MAKRKDTNNSDSRKENNLNSGKGNVDFDPYVNKENDEQGMRNDDPSTSSNQRAGTSGPGEAPGGSNKKVKKAIKEDDLKMPVASGDRKKNVAAESNQNSGEERPGRKKDPLAIIKEPAKITQAARGKFENSDEGSNSGAKGTKDLSATESKINLPESTASAKKGREKAAASISKRKEDKKEVTPQNTKSDNGSGKGTKKSKEKIPPGPEVKGSGKGKEDKKVYEKDTTITEDLKDIAMSTAAKWVEKLIPDEETRNEIAGAAMRILPDQEDIEKSIKKAKNKFSPEIEQVNKIVDRFSSKGDIKDKTEEIKTAAKNIKNRKQEKDEEKKSSEMSLISDYDVHLFKEGRHFHLYNKFGAHLMDYKGKSGVFFALWAPNAKNVSVIGDFNGWTKMSHPMTARQDESGIWEAFIPEAKKGSLYKYFIQSTSGYEAEKGDPFAFLWEVPPNTASIVWDLKSNWNDKEWLTQRKIKAGKAKPVSVYEMHLGSWKRVPEDGMRSLSYREMANQLPDYLNKLGFTHVEFMPVMEHPFFGSWGYQVTGYFAPSSRYGDPEDFMHLVDVLHQAGIGVILDWVPSHFPSDLHGLHYFDGTFLYEHEDPQKGFHPDWQSYIFNYGRNEVRSFLISNALFWLDKFHADGLRVDAVASMLYLDYSRKHGEWQPNDHGGNENLEAISFLKQFNEVVYSEFPDTITIAEESTAWPMVSRPTYMGGLGFGMKWMMGWMHDTLDYFQRDSVYRKHHQDTITFSTNYAFTENFMLPFSHDEVVYGKHSMLNKMPGDQWNKFSNLRALYAYMYAHPGTKLLFMGGEFGQLKEWGHDSSLDWHLTQEDAHRELQDTIAQLNKIYKSEPAFFEKSFDPEGFEWVDFNDRESSIISFLRKGNNANDTILVVCNLTPIPRENYRIGVPAEGSWIEIFNSDDKKFGGSNVKNIAKVETRPLSQHGKDHSVALTIPPMGVIYLKQK